MKLDAASRVMRGIILAASETIDPFALRHSLRIRWLLIQLLTACAFAAPPHVLYLEGTAQEIDAFARTGRVPGGVLRLVAMPSGGAEAYALFSIDDLDAGRLRETSVGHFETTQTFNPRTGFCTVHRFDNEKILADRDVLRQILAQTDGGERLRGALIEHYSLPAAIYPPGFPDFNDVCNRVVRPFVRRRAFAY